MGKLFDWLQSIISFIGDMFNKQTNIEKLFFIYFAGVFVVLVIIRTLYWLSKKKHEYINRNGKVRQIKYFAKILLFSLLFLTLIVGSTLKNFTDNILTYITVLFIVYYLADSVFLENGTILKLFNAEVKYDTIKENTYYMECIFRKNQMNSTLIEVTNSFIKESSDLINNNTNAYEALLLIIDTYVKEFNLQVERISKINSASLKKKIENYYIKNNIYRDNHILEKLTKTCHEGIISQINGEVFLVPICGLRYKEVIVVKGMEVDAIDATIIKNIAVLLY